MTEEPIASSSADAKTPQAQLDAHRAMVLWLFMATVLVFLILTVVLLLTDATINDRQQIPGHGRSSALLLVAMAGALGAFVSCLRRLYAFDDIFPRVQFAILFRKLDPYLIAYSTIPPLIGIIGAIVIYGIFAAELLKGPMFPLFSCADPGNGCRSLPEFLGYWRPSGPTDYAKAMVWGFISGFSERFFVDILNQFGGKASSSKDAPA